MPAIAANQKGDNNDDINDSGMDTMYFQDSPEKEDFNRTAEVLGPRPGKGVFNIRFLRERGMESNPKTEYQIFLCIFQKYLAMA